MKFKHLLAKSTTNPDAPLDAQTLTGHTQAVLESAGALLEAVFRPPASGFLPEEQTIWFGDALLCAAWLHDLGKANDHFQTMVRGTKPGFHQGVRHEGLGLAVAWEWIGPCVSDAWKKAGYPDWLWPAVLAAISGHHLKFPDEKKRDGSDVTFFGAHPDVASLMEIGSERFGFHVDIVRNVTFSLLPVKGLKRRISELRKNLQDALDGRPKIIYGRI